MLTTARHLSLSWARLIQSSTFCSYFKMYFNIILPSTPTFSKWSLSFRFPNKNLYTSLLSPIRATCHVHLVLLCFITRITFGKEYISVISSLCNFPKHACTPFPFGPNIFLSTLFSNSLSQSSSLNVTDQVPNPHIQFNKILESFLLSERP